jgi:hypothetical protein
MRALPQLAQPRCDSSAIRRRLIALHAAIFAAIGCIVVAVFVNGSLREAFSSPAWMTAAAIVTGLALSCCLKVRYALNAYCRSVGPACSDACSNLAFTLDAFFLLLAVQAMTSLIVAALALLFDARGPAWIILGTLALQVPLIFLAFKAYGSIRTTTLTPGH